MPGWCCGSLLNFFPIGWPQLDAVFEHGLAYARSVKFYDTTLFWQWMRLPGDVVFAVGALLMAWDFLVKLGSAISALRRTDHAPPGVACAPTARRVMPRMLTQLVTLIAAALVLFAPTARADDATALAEASNMQIIGRSDLNGVGKGGEGLAIKQYPGGQRVLYLAHESGPMCVSVLDVTHPEQPTIITQFKVEAPNVRCNSLGLAGNTLVVAHQTEKVGRGRRRHRCV